MRKHVVWAVVAVLAALRLHNSRKLPPHHLRAPHPRRPASSRRPIPLAPLQAPLHRGRRQADSLGNHFCIDLAIALHELQNFPVKGVQRRFHRCIVGSVGCRAPSACKVPCVPFCRVKSAEYAACRYFFGRNLSFLCVLKTQCWWNKAASCGGAPGWRNKE